MAKKNPVIVAIFTETSDGERYFIGSVMLDDTVDDVDAHFSVLREEWFAGLSQEKHDQDGDFIDWLIDNEHATVPPVDVTYAAIKEW